MDKKLQALYARQHELKEDEQNILNMLQLVREEMHKMQVEQLQWESMDMPISEPDNAEENASVSPQMQPLNESEVNSQAVNLEVPKLSELFISRIKNVFVDEEEEEEEEEEESEVEPDTENESNDEDLFSMI